MTSTPNTNFQLGLVLERIQSRQYFLLVVQHLLSELRTTRRRSSGLLASCGSNGIVSSTPPTPATTEHTLATFLDEGKKRKRSFTHFEGIPLSLIRPEIKAPANRELISSRRMRELERRMGRLRCEKDEDMASTDSDSADESDDEDIVIII